jgi:uncharacterized repeat protein (TIGR03803 family)
MLRLLARAKALLIPVPVAVLALLGATSGVSASGSLYDFCCLSDMPYLSIVDPTVSAAGSLYGVASQSLFGGYGYLFALVKSGNSYTYQTIYQFCSAEHCTDGSNPDGRLIVDLNGNLYGVTLGGGLSDSQPAGTVYELIPNADHSQWTRVTLYNFCQLQNCADGYAPAAGLTYAGAASGQLYDGVSPLYGVAETPDDRGLVYKLTRGKHGVWSEKVIHRFCQKASCSDGILPFRLAADASGNLVGLAHDGKGSKGIVFRLNASNRFHEDELYWFCRKENCSDGSLPSDIGLDAAGRIYGVTYQGGDGNAGVFFTITANGYKAYKKLGSDGVEPDTVLVTPEGKVYGTANSGLLFSYDDSGVHVISDPCCSGGVSPHGLAYGGGSSLYGTTEFGGANGAGLVYEQDLP